MKIKNKIEEIKTKNSHLVAVFCFHVSPIASFMAHQSRYHRKTWSPARALVATPGLLLFEVLARFLARADLLAEPLHLLGYCLGSGIQLLLSGDGQAPHFVVF